MKDRPPGVRDDDLVAALADGWGLTARAVAYRPVGFGSHHWTAEVADPGRGGSTRQLFVTVDVLSGERPAALARLTAALDTALALRRDAGLEFVVAPVPDRTGATVRLLGERHTVAVFPLVDGVAGDFGRHRREDVPAVLDLLVRLHGAAVAKAPRGDLVLPGRNDLEAALLDVGRPWSGGPFAEPARALLTRRTDLLRTMLGAFDRLAEEVREASGTWVVTHGEPHPGNVIRGATGLCLIDWDTVRLAPPERDLWMLDGDAELLARYTRETGHPVSPTALALYRLWWDLADIAVYVAELRGPHEAGEDTTAAWTYLQGHLAG
ncbi:phosphotransferase [Actinacidiphila acidipaludis]|uniref:Aminoglycoside phosphotransferase family protein n=1 Tax=Actinacidiphila acidipaludis TaxID=2873382 RepID=A0ABS7QG17_9ACTN|nr:phosphotransferase [Streptomyces acidipaludis]MBY8882110.1 aminoglycoside phosphotransferase family protein [Streptomyces acidipaludis]